MTTVQVAMDGVWEVNEHVPVGTVRDMDGGGWGVAYSHVTSFEYYGGLGCELDVRLIKKTVFRGARIATAPTEEFEIEGEVYVESQPNWGVDTALIEAAVRQMATELAGKA